MPNKTGKLQRPGATSQKQTRIVAVCNQKGGCGKTTSVINLGAGLSSLGLRVLVVDLDSQCNASTGLGYEGQESDLSSFDLMVRASEAPAHKVMVKTSYENLMLIPGSIQLSEFESRIAAEIGRENKLKKALQAVSQEFDIILLDTPPSLGLISVNALNAATEVQIAMQAHPFALDGLHLLLETIELVREELNPALEVTGVYITMFDTRTRISQEIRQAVMEMPELANKVFGTVIRQNVKVTEASQAKVPVMHYDPSCPGSLDYMSLAKEIALQSKSSVWTVAKNSKQKTNKGETHYV